MDFGLTDDQDQIQRTARDLLAERSRFERVREHAESGTSDDALWREVCELGWPGIAVAEKYGGQGLGRIELSILCEELGSCVAAIPFLPTALASTLIEHAGSAEQCERLLPGLASGENTGAVGVAVDGTAELVIGGFGASAIVLVDEDGGARVLSAGDAEVARIESIDPTRSAARVSAPADAGEELEGDVAGGIDRALIAVSSELVGVCDRALKMTVEYVKERRQFGVPVGSYQAVSHRCAQMLLETEMARSTAAYAAWSADADPSLLSEAAALAKAAASAAGREVTASAIQAHGGIGFTWEADVHWLYKRAQIDASLLGGAKRQRARLAQVLAERAGAAQLG
jgi:alkylation response protein AidB-like acyl-CoA dehydrogenase